MFQWPTDTLPEISSEFTPENQWLASWWLNQPIWNACSSNWIISPGKVRNKKYLSCHHLVGVDAFPFFWEPIFCLLDRGDPGGFYRSPGWIHVESTNLAHPKTTDGNQLKQSRNQPPPEILPNGHSQSQLVQEVNRFNSLIHHCVFNFNWCM